MGGEASSCEGERERLRELWTGGLETEAASSSSMSRARDMTL